MTTIVDPRIAVGSFRIPPHELLHKGWHGYLARWLNRVRVFCEHWAGHHTVVALVRDNPVVLEDALQHFATAGRFREMRGGVAVPNLQIPFDQLSKDDQALMRLARLTAPERAKRYASGRRVFTMYEADNVEQPETTQ